MDQLVTAEPAAEAVVGPVIPVAPAAKNIGVDAGMLKSDYRVTVMALGTTRLPPAEVVKPTVQVEESWAACEPRLKATLVSGSAEAGVTISNQVNGEATRYGRQCDYPPSAV